MEFSTGAVGEEGGYVQVTVDLVVRAMIKYSNINAFVLASVLYEVYARASERGYELERRERNEMRGKVGWHLYSALNRAPPPPHRMIARMNARKRSAYSAGGTGLILCYV
jgi:hypothetical protein